jgi:hypothetical protein
LGALVDLPDLTARLSAAFTSAGVRHVVSGAIALAAHGFVRATRAIDVLVVVPAVRLPEVFGIVRSFGFEGEDAELLDALRDRYVAEMRSGATAIEILVPVLPYHGTLIDRAVTLEVGDVQVPFVSPEDIFILRMLWRRTKDLADAKALAAALHDSLDRAYILDTLGSMLPAEDTRHAETEALLDPGC